MHTCLGLVPSLPPKQAGNRVKTKRRDSLGWARLLRELTPGWVPDVRHAAIRERTRARNVAREDLTRKRRQVSSLLLR